MIMRMSWLRVICAALTIGASAGIFLGTASAQGASGEASLPPGPGRHDFARACSKCHAFEVATARRESQSGWLEIVNSMRARGAALTSDQATQVVAYLAKNFGSGTPPAAMQKGATGKKPAFSIPFRYDASEFIKNRPPHVTPLESIRPVTDAMLASPPQGDWLTWRRTYDDFGYSPLTQIDKSNVWTLTIAWSWSLPPGANEGTPLEHDGVLFIQSYGDIVQAFDASTGDLLWQYTRSLPGAPFYKKNIAIYKDKIIAATSDGHLVALDIRTGKVVWDTAIVGGGGYVNLSGGPLIADGKVLQGTIGFRAGGNYLVGLDADTGKKLWRFDVVPMPGHPGGDSWNGEPFKDRTGGSIWTTGSYDARLNLVYFGTGNTYGTGPLRRPVNQPGVTNDALYTDTTLAIDPDTGKLIWHYQHMPNDQWDMDWAFERKLIDLPVDGKTRELVVTAGKPMIYDALDAATGAYVFSMDLGLQNLVIAIDQRTGRKTINPALLPDRAPFFMCPYFNSGKEWLPGSYSPPSNMMYEAVNEACMDMYKLPPGERGLLTGLGFQMHPRPNSDGNYAHLVAWNLKTRQIIWTHRQRAPLTTGTLATAGGLVFAGSVDRRFAAFDDETGEELWSARLNDVPSSAPITYEVNGKQYVAIVVGCCGVQARDAAALVPDVQNPPDHGAAIWVFELPTKSHPGH